MRQWLHDAKAMEHDNRRDHDRLCHSLPNADQLSDLLEYLELPAKLVLHLGKRMHRPEEQASEVRQHELDGFRALN